MEKYNKRVWINSQQSHYTGSIVLHDGVVSNRGQPRERYTFIEVSDCHGKVRIHYDNNLYMSDYIDKLQLIRDELDLFIEHLKK